VRRKAVTTLAVVIVAFGRVDAARGQGWAADVSAGRLVYDAVSANVGTSNVIGSLRYDTRSETWVYGAVAAPAGETDPFWAAAGAGGRVTPVRWQSGRASAGADLGAHWFSFHDRVAAESGAGGTLEAIPFVRIDEGLGFVEGRGGWRGQTLSFAGLRDTSGVFEWGARGGYGTTVRVEGDVRWIRASGGIIYPSIGATVVYALPRADVWGQIGKWLATDLDDRVWAVGSAVSLGTRTSVWGSVRQEAPDPLYWNLARRTWTIGLTQRLGRMPAPLVPIARSQAGSVVVRVSVVDAPEGVVSIAGDFNNWQPAPMEREGDEWFVSLVLAPGVYHYAFRSANGEWFVPPSTPGRRDDGMGGYLAILVVS
jgi:hypothetical protein